MNRPEKFQTTDSYGRVKVYRVGDIVSHGGGTYRALRRTTHYDGIPENNPGIWEPLSTSIRHTSGENAPLSPNVGDEWYDTANGILFKYLDDGNSDQWVEIG